MYVGSSIDCVNVLDIVTLRTCPTSVCMYSYVGLSIVQRGLVLCARSAADVAGSSQSDGTGEKPFAHPPPPSTRPKQCYLTRYS